MLASESVLAACDAVGELELYVGGGAAGDANFAGFADGLAVANDFGAHRVDVARADFEVRGLEHAAVRGRSGHAAVNGQTGVGREADDDRGRDLIHDFLRVRNGFAGHRLRGRRNDDGAAATRAADAANRGGADGVAGMAATITQAREQAAVAVAAAAGAAAGRRANDDWRRADDGATRRATGGAAVSTAMMNARRASGGAADNGGATRGAADDGGAARGAADNRRAAMIPVAAVAEVNRIRAGSQCQHQNC